MRKKEKYCSDEETLGYTLGGNCGMLVQYDVSTDQYAKFALRSLNHRMTSTVGIETIDVCLVQDLLQQSRNSEKQLRIEQLGGAEGTEGFLGKSYLVQLDDHLLVFKYPPKSSTESSNDPIMQFMLEK